VPRQTERYSGGLAQALNYAAQRLLKKSLDAIWGIWHEFRGHLGGGQLPLSRSNFDQKEGWKGYIPLLFAMLKDIDNASDLESAGTGPTDQPTMNWTRYM
jgi:hypothetical protein